MPIIEAMFERATAFSAIFVFISFGVIGVKYLSVMKSKEQANQTSSSIFIEKTTKHIAIFAN